MNDEDDVKNEEQECCSSEEKTVEENEEISEFERLMKELVSPEQWKKHLEQVEIANRLKRECQMNPRCICFVHPTFDINDISNPKPILKISCESNDIDFLDTFLDLRGFTVRTIEKTYESEEEAMKDLQCMKEYFGGEQ